MFAFDFIHAGDCAREAMAAGVDGIMVSNHGGRQLDGVPASVRQCLKEFQPFHNKTSLLNTLLFYFIPCLPVACFFLFK